MTLVDNGDSVEDPDTDFIMELCHLLNSLHSPITCFSKLLVSFPLVDLVIANTHIATSNLNLLPPSSLTHCPPLLLAHFPLGRI